MNSKERILKRFEEDLNGKPIGQPPMGALTKIVFGNGSEAGVLHIRNNGNNAVMVIVPNREFIQLNNIDKSKLTNGKLILAVDSNSIIELNNDPMFRTLLCTKDPENKETAVSMAIKNG